MHCNNKTLQSIFTFVVLIGLQASGLAQNTEQEKPQLEVSGFLEVFYAYDFNRPKTDFRQTFLYNHNRHSEFNLNFGCMKLALRQANYRANFALQTGTYANDNYRQEPDLLKNIFEANIGISLNQRNDLWLDAGVFASHLGFESSISADNWTLTRSLAAENSPYFLSGAKLTYTPYKKWEFAALVLNGWQRIQRLQGNSMPSWGTQLNYKPTDNASLNWSTFLGTDDPDSTRRMRYFNNFYAQLQISQKLGLIAGFDIGMQQNRKGSSFYDFWLVYTLIAQYQIKEKWKTALRAEYYQDQKEIIIQTANQSGFQTGGFSWNIDYLPNEKAMCRIEARLFNSRYPIFEIENTKASKNNFILVGSIAIKLNQN